MAREKLGLTAIIRSIPDAIAWELEKRLNRITLNTHRPEPTGDGPICLRCSIAAKTEVRWPCPEAKAVIDRIQDR